MAATNVLIVFYSRNGSVEALAKAMAESAQEAGAEVRMRRARDIVSEETIRKVPGWAENRERMEREYPAPTEADIAWADGVLFGTPTRFGNVCAELKAFIDGLGGIWLRGGLFNKAAGAFTSTSSVHGGNETTSLSLYNPLAHLGFVIVPNGYGEPITFAAGSPYGSSSVSWQSNTAPTAEDILVARYQGKRLTAVAHALKALRST